MCCHPRTVEMLLMCKETDQTSHLCRRRIIHVLCWLAILGSLTAIIAQTQIAVSSESSTEPKCVQAAMHDVMLVAANAVRTKYPQLKLQQMSYIVSTGDGARNSGNHCVTFFPTNSRDEVHVGGGVMVTVERNSLAVLSVELTQ